MFIKSGQFIKLYEVIIYNHIRLFIYFLQATGVFEAQSNIYGEAFLQKNLTAKSPYLFLKKLDHTLLVGF